MRLKSAGSEDVGYSDAVVLRLWLLSTLYRAGFVPENGTRIKLRLIN